MADKTKLNILLHPRVNGVEDMDTILYPETRKQTASDIDSGITAGGSLLVSNGQGGAKWNPPLTKVAYSGNYNDLTDCPDINDGTLTISAGGNIKGSFTANSADAVSINITAADLGLSTALRFVGRSITDPKGTNGATLEDGRRIFYKGEVVFYGGAEYVNLDDQNIAASWEELGDAESYALKTIKISGANGINGSGTLASDITLSLDNEIKTGAQLGATAVQPEDLASAFVAHAQTAGQASKVTDYIGVRHISSIFESDSSSVVKEATKATNVALSMTGSTGPKIVVSAGSSSAEYTVTDVANVTTKINDKPISDIFEENGTTAKVATKALNADLAASGTGTDTITISAGDGTAASFTINNVVNAQNATNVNLSSTGTGTDTIKIQAGSAGDTTFTVNNVAKATAADTATSASYAIHAGVADEAENADLTLVSGDGTDTIELQIGNGEKAKFTINNVKVAEDATNVRISGEGSGTDTISLSAGTTAGSYTFTVNDVASANNVKDTINGKAISNIFEEDGLTVKSATNAVNVNLSSSGSDSDTIIISAGNKNTQFVINNVAKAATADFADSATSATDVDLDASDSQGPTVVIKAGSGTSASHTVDNVANAANITATIDGKALNTIFEDDGTTAKLATNVLGTGKLGTTASSETDKDRQPDHIFEQNSNTVKKATGVTSTVGGVAISNILEPGSTAGTYLSRVKSATKATEIQYYGINSSYQPYIKADGFKIIKCTQTQYNNLSSYDDNALYIIS